MQLSATINWYRVSATAIFSGLVLLPLGFLAGLSVSIPANFEIGLLFASAIFYLTLAFVLNRRRQGPVSLIILAGLLAVVVAFGGAMREKSFDYLVASVLCALIACVFLLFEAAKAQRVRSVGNGALSLLMVAVLGVGVSTAWAASNSIHRVSPYFAMTSADISELDPRVEEVIFFGIGDAELAMLGPLPKLQTVSFRHCNGLTSAGIALLVDRSDLKTVVIESCFDVEDSAIAALVRAPNLERVYLLDCAMVTVGGVERLTASPGLREVIVRACPNMSFDELLTLRRHHRDILFNIVAT